MKGRGPDVPAVRMDWTEGTGNEVTMVCVHWYANRICCAVDIRLDKYIAQETGRRHNENVKEQKCEGVEVGMELGVSLRRQCPDPFVGESLGVEDRERVSVLSRQRARGQRRAT